MAHQRALIEVASCSHLTPERTTGRSITAQLRLSSCPKPLAAGNQCPVPTCRSKTEPGARMASSPTAPTAHGSSARAADDGKELMLGTAPPAAGTAPQAKKSSPRRARPSGELECLE